ncbi:MAG: DUF4442 domain-containing protein, partial [Burkholderiales bacterium]
MKPTDLALNQTFGIADAPAAATHVLELPFTLLVRNHIGTVHAAAQFALAEAAAAERLRRDFGAQAGDVVPIMRSVELKYRQPATGDLLAYASVAPDDRSHLLSDLAQAGRTLVTVEVELKD